MFDNIIGRRARPALVPRAAARAAVVLLFAMCAVVSSAVMTMLFLAPLWGLTHLPTAGRSVSGTVAASNYVGH